MFVDFAFSNNSSRYFIFNLNDFHVARIGKWSPIFALMMPLMMMTSVGTKVLVIMWLITATLLFVTLVVGYYFNKNLQKPVGYIGVITSAYFVVDLL